MKYILCSIALVLSSTANAATKVNYLNVEGDIVVFTTDEAKSVASPSCVVTETAQQWSVSLSSPSGRTLYSLLATSLAGGLNVTVASAQDCSDITGVERALSITVEPIETASTPTTPTASGSGLSLYKGDGVTKLGPVIGVTNGYVGYIDLNDPMFINNHKLQARKSGNFMYAQNDCQGTAYLTSSNSIGYDALLNGGTYYKSSGGSYTPLTIKSRRNNTGGCDYIGTNTYNVHAVDFSYVDPLCGEHACMIK